jgi:hypothetical protein
MALPEQPRIPIMLADMVDFEGQRDLSTLRARIRLIEQNLLA